LFVIQQQVIFELMFFTNLCGTGGWGCSSAPIRAALGVPVLAQLLFGWGGARSHFMGQLEAS